MSKAHDELRKRLNAYREAKALYDGPDPYDREEARYDAMRVALGRIGYDETLAQSLLDDHERLDEALERPVVIWHYREDEEELPSCDDPDEAIYNAIHEAGWGMCGKLERPGMLEETVTVYGFARMAPKVQAWRYLEQVLEDLDEEHSDGSATKATPAMVEAADAFAAAIEREYVSWACEVVEKRVVNVREWCAVHRPGWLAQLPAVEPKEGGDHG